MVKKQISQTMQMPTTLLDFERILRDKNFKNLSREVFGEGSRCRRVIRRKTDCTPDPSTMMTAIMCLPTGELIATEDGLKPIETIQIGNKVLTHKGRYRKVTKTFKREYDGEIIEIKTNGSPDPLRVTPEHPVFGANITRPSVHGGQVMTLLQSQWMEAKTLTEETMLQYPKLTEEKDIEYLHWCATKKIRGWNLKTLDFPVEEDFMRLCGYYVSEGATLKYKNNIAGIKLTFGKNLKEFFLAIDAVSRAVKLGFGAWVSPHVRGYNVHVTSRSLGEYMQQHFGTGSINKKIPTWLLKLPVNKLQWFFDSYIEGDGGRYKRNNKTKCDAHIRASTISSQLAIDLKNLGIKLNYRTSVQRCKSSNIILGRKVNTHPIHRIIFNEFGKRKDSRIYLDNKYEYLKVKEIKKTHYKGYVWNFEVEEDESYCTAYHTVHNCRVWYSPGGANPKELLVDTFRRVMKNEWVLYKSVCPRPKSGKR